MREEEGATQEPRNRPIAIPLPPYFPPSLLPSLPAFPAPALVLPAPDGVWWAEGGGRSSTTGRDYGGERREGRREGWREGRRDGGRDGGRGKTVSG